MIEFNLGVGLRSTHFSDILDNKLNNRLDNKPKALNFFEIVSENFMDIGGIPFDKMMRVRNDYKMAMHGVSLSIGSTNELNQDYLKKLKALIDRVEPFVVSDHLCFTGENGINSHDLLPVAYTEETLNFIAEKVEKVQEHIGRQILLENPSAYVGYKNNEFEEYEFLNELCKRSGCGMLLDVNNVYVSAFNMNSDAVKYIDSINTKYIKQIHLGGFTDYGSYLFDTHSMPVFEKVWSLYERYLKRDSSAATLIEWDNDIPKFEILLNEAKKAEVIWNRVNEKENISDSITERTTESVL